ncbi:RNA polymerase sigma factor [Bacillus sp. PK3-056]|uniref:RNA polymerase sigma factor n=1 Tax=Niallia TaxID=2837506 RepID=UPI00201DA088|nr:RNA polymerase sigma factor [Niallia circulans]
MPDFDLNKLNDEMNVVYNYLRKLKITHMDAQDIVQETTYKFLLHYDAIRTSNIRSWLIRVALNIFYDQLRKNKNIVLTGFEEDRIIPNFRDSPEDILINNENKDNVYKTLSKIKPKYGEVLFLKYILELKYDEIAVLLDMNLNTVKTYLARARKDFIRVNRRLEREQ